MTVRLIFAAFAIMCMSISSDACTSMIISARASASGRPMLWKHRDTSSESNFIERVNPTDTSHGYVALFNTGDSLLAEAWIGVNDVDFAIMNTASYNLAPDTAFYKDREGFVMTEALKRCRTVDDFENLLLSLSKPLGVQANFGVIDAEGNGAYFETDDYSFKKFDLADAENGVLIRTNFSFSGNDGEGYGYIRFDNASHLLAGKIASRSITPADLTEGVSRSFYHSLFDKDMMSDDSTWIVDQDFVPRSSSTASIVIEGAGNDGSHSTMWTALGYPPCAIVEAVTLDNVPDNLRPTLPGFKSLAAETALANKRRVFSIRRGSGPRYINIAALRPIMEQCHAQSMKNYER